MNDDPGPIAPSSLAPILRPLRAFLAAESSGAILLVIATVAALIWANSPLGDRYYHFWHAPISIDVAGRALNMSLAHWVNDGLMVLFFLLVGLEIKRELLIGELASARRAALPLAAAIGGMVVPALFYALLNARRPGSHGWGAPMATDIAFALGVLSLIGRSVPTSVKVFLLAIAIVDDLGAVLVIAFFYSGEISLLALAAGGAFLVCLIALNFLHVHRPLPYLLLGLGLWIATLHSGLHATIAGVLLAFTIPATRQMEERPYVGYMRDLLDHFEREILIDPARITAEQSHVLSAVARASQSVQTSLARVEHALLKPVNFLVVPLFALANAGVDLRGAGLDALGSRITWGVIIGLLIGKPLGVLLATFAALRLGGTLPAGASVRLIVGISLLCGIGFTMSLFVANLAFPGRDAHLAESKIGILAGSLVCGVLGALTIRSKVPAAHGAAPSS
jgi:NhaA family Na+:H+ antiporter